MSQVLLTQEEAKNNENSEVFNKLHSQEKGKKALA